MKNTYCYSSGKTKINVVPKSANMNVFMYGKQKNGSRVVGNRNGHKNKRFVGKGK